MRFRPKCWLVGCRSVIIAHSERRQFFGETDESAARKVKAALEAGLTPILCVGELLSEREGDQTRAVLDRQLRGSLAALTGAEFSRIIVAYEPVWAIGTGRTATPEIAAEAHRFLRDLAGELFGAERAAGLRILYGGSVKPDNVKGLMAQVDIDGALVGGASLDPAAVRLHREISKRGSRKFSEQSRSWSRQCQAKSNGFISFVAGHVRPARARL